jgi:hypothetical protein
VLQLAAWKFRTGAMAAPASLRLGAVCDALDIDVSGVHDALTDCRLAIEVFRRVR